MIPKLEMLASIVGWLICLACFAPGVARLIFRRGRDLDPIWALVFLLVLNRMILTDVSPDGSRWAAQALSLVLAGFSVWYQRRDA